MDIVGIYWLYKYGAVGGWWIDQPMPGVMDYVTEDNTAGPALEVVLNRKKAHKGAKRGLWTTAVGFGLQILAQVVILYT